MSREYKFGLYVGASLLSAALIYFFFFVQPHNLALASIDKTTERLNVFTDAIKISQFALQDQAGPSIIKSGVIGETRDFNRQLSQTITALNIESFDLPEPINNHWRDNRINSFNNVASGTNFIADVESANGTVNKVRIFATYHYEVMQALRNILEYNPQDDLSITDTEGLLTTIRAAGTGIDNTLQKLKAQTYANDPKLEEIISALEVLETKRFIYEQAIETGNIRGTQYQDFINSVQDTQNNIIANRQLFWEANQPGLAIGIQTAYESIVNYRNLLNNL